MKTSECQRIAAPDAWPMGRLYRAPKLQQQIERLTHLPKAKQKAVMEMIEGMLSQNR